MNKINGEAPPVFEQSTHYPYEAIFDGNQAVAFSRIRKYKGGGDSVRANRQMEIVKKTVKKSSSSPNKNGKTCLFSFPKRWSADKFKQKRNYILNPKCSTCQNKNSDNKDLSI